MKRSILITVFLGLFFLPVLSQKDTQLKLNNKSEGISVYDSRKPFYQASVFDFSALLNDSLYNRKVFIPKIPDKQLYFNRIPFSEPTACHCHCNQNHNHNIDNIPILKPVGKYAPMEIYRADPRDKYTLLIKD
jgi:hypothetical protein